MPAYVATTFVILVASAVALFLVPPFRPALLDFNTAFSLALLGLIIVAAAALPLYVAVRAAVSRALELADPDAMTELLDQAEASESAKKRLVWRLLIAIATPVGFVAVGASLVAHAHVRKFDAQSREQTAEIVARVALEASPGAVDEAGRAEAIDAARSLGFVLRPERQSLKFSVERGDDGRVSLTTPLEEGAANIRFQLSSVGPVTAADVGIAALAVALAAALGLALGRSLSERSRTGHAPRAAPRHRRGLARRRADAHPRTLRAGVCSEPRHRHPRRALSSVRARPGARHRSARGGAHSCGRSFSRA